MMRMTAQVVRSVVVSEEMLEVLGGLTVDQCRQVMNFARFLACQEGGSVSGHEAERGLVDDRPIANWVDEVSGSMKDIPEFDDVVAYGQAARQGEDSELSLLETL